MTAKVEIKPANGQPERSGRINDIESFSGDDKTYVYVDGQDSNSTRVKISGEGVTVTGDGFSLSGKINRAVEFVVYGKVPLSVTDSDGNEISVNHETNFEKTPDVSPEVIMARNDELTRDVKREIAERATTPRLITDDRIV